MRYREFARHARDDWPRPTSPSRVMQVRPRGLRSRIRHRLPENANGSVGGLVAVVPGFGNRLSVAAAAAALSLVGTFLAGRDVTRQRLATAGGRHTNSR
jgi:hypothetical protein